MQRTTFYDLVVLFDAKHVIDITFKHKGVFVSRNLMLSAVGKEWEHGRANPRANCTTYHAQLDGLYTLD